MTSAKPTILDFAENFAANWGWAVFPCHSIGANGKCTCGDANCKSPGKHPMTPNGSKDATRDLEQIRKWFGSGDANIGLATGEISNLAVVDVDEAKGGRIADLLVDGLDREWLDNTPRIKTGGGWHFYYQLPEGVSIKNSAGRLGKHIDVRGNGGYVIAPPSRHVSGTQYELVNAPKNTLPFPEPWLNRLTGAPAVNGNGKTNAYGGDGFFVPPPTPLFEMPETIGDGGRNATLAQLGGSLRRMGMSEYEIESALLLANQERCNPPLDISEVRKIARSVARYAPAITATPVVNGQPAQAAQVTDDSVINWDDVSIARMFVAEQKDKLRFNADQKKWLVWAGNHWKTDRTDEAIKAAAVFSQSLYVKAPSLVTNQGDMTAAQRQVKRSNTSVGLSAFVNLSKPYLGVTSDMLDRGEYLLNCKNGVVDLRTGKLQPHNAADLMTKLVPFDYDESAISAAWTKFIETVQPDPVIRKFLQMSIGYSLLGVARERTFWILYGSGNNGKSVFLDIISELLAEYASSTASASVMSQKVDRIPNDIARLHGKRFIVIPETEENERINASLIKALSGGDKITARFLFGEFFNFYFSGKLWIATNHKPQITDHSKGFWDRLKIIPFTVDIPASQVIKKDTLIKSILADAPAVLKWAVDGCRQYLAVNDLNVPDSIKAEIAAYKYEQDSIAQFMDNCCEVGPYFSVSNKTLYDKYKEYCRDSGEHQRSQRRFTANLKERGFSQRRDASGVIWDGLKMQV